MVVNGRQFERRRFLGLLGAGGLVAGGAVTGYIAAAVPSQAAEDGAREDGAFAPTSTGSQQVLWSVATDEAAIALTFDDGPNPAFTPRVLDILAAVGARATFFVIGEQAGRAPGLLRRILAEGHEVGNHTWSHRSAALISAEDTRGEIRRATEALTAATGTPPRFYRPPRGMLTGSALEHAHLLGQQVVLWSVDRGPAVDTDGDGVRRHLIEHLAPGAIIDLHDGVGAASGRPRTEWPAKLLRRRETELAVLPDVLAAGRARGFRFVTLTELVALTGA